MIDILCMDGPRKGRRYTFADGVDLFNVNTLDDKALFGVWSYMVVFYRVHSVMLGAQHRVFVGFVAEIRRAKY